MKFTTQLKRGVSLAILAGAALAAPAAGAYTITFDGLANGAVANGDAVALANGVSFSSGTLADIYDADWNVVGQHWITDATAGALVAANPTLIGWGTTPSAANGLDARFDQVLMQFAAPLQLSSFSFATDNSSFGFPGYTHLEFLDANGQTIATSADFIQAATTSFTADFSASPLTVSGVLLPAGKFYDDVSVTAVPEPGTTALMVSGLLLLGAVTRRQWKR